MKKLSLLVLPLMAVSFLTNCGGSKEPIKSSYTLTYTYDNGSDDKYVETYTEDKKTVKPTWEPTYPGYTFDGWFTKPGIEGSLFTFGSTLTADTVVFAHWKSGVKDFIVYFDTNGGSPAIERQIVKEDHYAKDPLIDLKRGGDSFRYWSLQDEEDDSPNEFIFKDNKITSDITLHAIYTLDPNGPLAITCTKGSMNLSLYWGGQLSSPSELDIKWSKNKIEWTDVKVTLVGTTEQSKIAEFEIDLNENETVYLAGDNPNGFSFNNDSNGTRLVRVSNELSDTQSEFEVSGNVLSLIDSTDYKSIVEIPSACFYGLFAGSNIKSAKNLILSCNQLSDSCYAYMFRECKKLVEAPNLPAMNLAENCYYYMFGSCIELIEAPFLPVSSFDENCVNCYGAMFKSCIKLAHLKVGFGENDVWPKIINLNDFTSQWLIDALLGIFEWKGSENPTTFDRNVNTVPSGWTIKPY